MDVKSDPHALAFEAFVRADGQRLRKAMVSRYGVDVGCESTDAALAWAWEHWDRLRPMSNPAGYLYRVAQTHARRSLRRGRTITFPAEPQHSDDSAQAPLDGDLATALVTMPEPQRTAVLLVHVYGWTPAEVAQLTGVPSSTIRSHLRRGLRRLRTTLQKETAS